MFNRSAMQANEIPEPPLPYPGQPPDSERAKQPSMPETAYMPYADKPAPSGSPYKPYADKPAPDERPYEPYKDI
jgi:hypothetical protein